MLPNFIKKSLLTKLVLTSVIIELVMLSVLLGNSIRIIDNTIAQESLVRTESASLLLDSALSIPLFERDSATMNQLLEKLIKSKNSEFSYIKVYDDHDRLYAQIEKPRLDSIGEPNLSPNILRVSAQITIADEKVGFFEYGLSVQGLADSRQSLFQQGITIAIIEIILSILLLGSVGFLLTRHIGALLYAVKKVSAGSYNTDIPVESTDEIGTLADNFNQMTKAIQGRIIEITETSKALMEAKEKAQVTLESIGDAVITTNEKGCVQYLNPVAEKLTGWTTLESIGRPLPEVFNIRNEQTKDLVENPVERCLRENIIVGLANHTELVNRNGNIYAIEDSAAPIRDKQGNILGVILVFHDVSKARSLANQLNWQASHDSLTGLINRFEFEIRLGKILDDSYSESNHAMLYIDLDQFKVVNDTCGHIAGDELLKQLSQLFQKHKRERDTLARLGGDEFGMLLENCPAKQAKEIAEDIIYDLKLFHFLWEKKMFVTGASIGMVPFKNDNSETISSLMSAADVACYSAKDAGRNRVHVYQLDDKGLVQRHGEMQWVAKIQAALDEDLFELYCQPIVSTNNLINNIDHVEHYEILIRMRDTNGDIILPVAFLPAAERYNLMPNIDRWVIKSVIAQLNQFSPKVNSKIAINLSGKSLSDLEFLDFVIHIFDKKLVRADQICFEITETAAITNLSRVTLFIATLQKHGCQFSLDDFGSGLSSFRYLKNLNVNFLKIDGAFVKDMTEDLVDRGMVESINQIGHVMSIKTIAEYVETQEILELLTEMGVDYVQGFHIARPFPFKDLA